MLTRRAIPFALAAPLAASQVRAAPVPAASGPRAAEARALRLFAETTHPRGREAAVDPTWRQDWARLEAEADGMTAPAYLMALKARLAWFRDGHTTLYISAITAPGFELRLPIAVQPFHDGLYVVAAKDDGAPLLGARVTRVEGVEIAPFLRRFAAGWPGNNPAWAHHDAGLALVPAIMRGAGLTSTAEPGAPVAIEGEIDGRPVQARLTPSATGRDKRTALTRTPSAIERWKPEGAANFLHREGPALVIAYDSLSEDLGSTLKFVREAFTAMEAPDVERVVLDLRRNGGGNNYNGEGLRKALERSRFNRPGGLYVLIGPQTFSAAQNLTTRVERETYAIFVGEPTGGAPNHHGDATPFKGDDFIAGVSTVPWFDSYPGDTRIWTAPDLMVPARFADWVGGQDPVLEAALTHTTDAKPNDLSQDRTFFFARASQKVAWKPFWME